MTEKEAETILESFRIIVDTREQETPKARRRYKAIGVPLERATLSYGDYCGNVEIDGKPLLDLSARI